MADVRAVYDQHETNGLLDYARSLQTGTPATSMTTIKSADMGDPNYTPKGEKPVQQQGEEIVPSFEPTGLSGAVIAGGKALTRAFMGGGERVAQGILRIGDSPVQGARDIVMGLVQMVPGAVTAFTGEAVTSMIDEHFGKGVLDTEITKNPEFIRMLTSGDNPLRGTDAEQRALKSPMTLRELINLGVQMATPVVGAWAAQKGLMAPKASAEPKPGAPAKAPAAVPEAPSTTRQHASATGTMPAESMAFGTEAIKPSLNPVTPEHLSRLMADELPQPDTAPRQHGINWTRIGSEESVKRVTLEINRQLQEGENAKLGARGETRTSEGAGGRTQTHAMTKARAAEMPFTMEEIAQGEILRPGDTVADLPARLTALKAYRDVVDRHLWSAVDMAKGGDPSAIVDMPTVVAVSKMVNERVKDVTSAISRAQEAQKIISDGRVGGVDPIDLQTTIENLTAEMSGADIAHVLHDLRATHGRPAATSWARRVINGLKHTKNMAWEYYIMAKLTSPTTWAKKAASDALTITAALPERAIARFNHQLFWNDDPLGVQPGEVRAMAEGYADATINIVRLIAQGRDLTEIPGAEHWSREPAIAAATLNIRGLHDLAVAAMEHDVSATLMAAPGAALDVVGAAVRSGGTVLGAITKLAQGVNYGGEMKTQAVRLATMELRPLEDSPVYAERFASRVQALLDDPKDRMVEAAQDAARRNTYTQELGPAGKAFEAWMNSVPGMRLNFLYYRVPLNLFKRSTHYFPPTWGASMIWGEMGDMWAQGGAARETALARLEMGVVATAAVGFLMAQGKLTDGGPTDPGARERWLATGRLPYHFYPYGQGPGMLGYGYHAIAPFGIHVGTIADIGGIVAQIPEGSGAFDLLAQVAAATVLGQAESMRDEGFSKSWSEMVSALKDPNVGSEKWMTNFMHGLSPAIYQRGVRTYIDNSMKELRGPLDGLRATIWQPGLVDRRDPIKGNSKLYPPGLGPDMVSPITVSEITSDPVDQEFYAQRIKVSRIPWSVAGPHEPTVAIQMKEPSGREGVTLSGPQRDRWIDLITTMKNGRGETLHDALDNQIRTDRYQRLPVFPTSEERAAELHMTINDFRARALQALRREDHALDAAMKAKETLHTTNRLPTTHQRSTGSRPGGFPGGLQR